MIRQHRNLKSFHAEEIWPILQETFNSSDVIGVELHSSTLLIEVGKWDFN